MALWAMRDLKNWDRDGRRSGSHHQKVQHLEGVMSKKLFWEVRIYGRWYLEARRSEDIIRRIGHQASQNLKLVIHQSIVGVSFSVKTPSKTQMLLCYSYNGCVCLSCVPTIGLNS